MMEQNQIKKSDEESNVKCENIVECSASNKHCVTSLIIALSTYPLVLSVETEGPIASNDYEAQWVTQSKVQNSRPLRDIGIHGENQIISIVDTDLDVNHEYFGPTSDKVFDVSIFFF